MSGYTFADFIEVERTTKGAMGPVALSQGIYNEPMSVFMLFQHYIGWLAQEHVAATADSSTPGLTITTLLCQLEVIAAYQVHVLQTIKNASKAYVLNMSHSVTTGAAAIAVPEEIKNNADVHRDQLEKIVNVHVPAIHNAVYDAVLARINQYRENWARGYFALTVAATAALLTSAFTLNMPPLAAIFSLVLGVTSAIFVCLYTGLMCTERDFRFTTITSIPETSTVHSRGGNVTSTVNAENYYSKFTYVKRQALDKALSAYDMSLFNQQIANVMGGETRMPGVTEAVAMTTKCFITSRYDTKYKRPLIKGDDAHNEKTALALNVGNTSSVDLQTFATHIGRPTV